MYKRLLVIFLLLNLVFHNCSSAQTIPLPNGFAHNDYMHKHPLFEALQNGFANIEADIFLLDKRLVVAHYFPFFKGGRTLENLYLKPLHDYVQQHNGVYNHYNKPVILMIDIKSDANRTYLALEPLLQKYADMLSYDQNGVFVPGKITVVLSGNKPFGLLEGEKRRIAFFDTDFGHVDQDQKSGELYAMSSCKYSKILHWTGHGLIPERQEERLKQLISIAHAKGRKVRLWASPENDAVWNELLADGVDLINTDKLVTLKTYLLSHDSAEVKMKRSYLTSN